MPVVRVRDVDIEFPYSPYDAQLEYMTGVVDALNGASRALLESPTGTGKTLCLLCACCAWVQQQRPQGAGQMLQPAAGGSLTLRPARRGAPSTSTDINGVMGRPEPKSVVPLRLVFTSRTHAQLAQVVREFKKTVYADDMEMAVLGSREHLCVHNSVSKLTNGQFMTSACATAREDGRCRHFNSIKYMLSTPHRLRALSGADGGVHRLDTAYPEQEAEGAAVHASSTVPTKLARVHDIEDLAKAGRSVGFCPYFYERAVAKEAQIVFLPYTYLFEPSVRKQLPFSLTDSILIIDEAHNIPSVLSSGANTMLPPVVVSQAMREVSTAMDMVRGEVRQGDVDNARALELTLKEESFGCIKLILSNLEGAIETTANTRGANLQAVDASSSPEGAVVVRVPPLPPQMGAGSSAASNNEVVLRGTCIFDLLRLVELTKGKWDGHANLTGLSEAFNQVIGTLATSDIGCTAVGAVQQFLSNIFDNEATAEEIDESCRVVLTLSQQGRDGATYGGHRNRHSGPARGTEAAAGQIAWSLGFWSLNTSSNMLRALDGVRSLIMTSGTLSPMDHFIAELGIAFQITLVGRHVIQPTQVMCSVLCKGPSGQSLNGTYAFRNSEEYRLALGYSILNIARSVPNGMLVFFPSYAAVHASMELWKMTGGPQCAATLWGQMSEVKSLFQEPVDGGELAKTVEQYQAHAEQSPGAMLFAVCRGKVSEGVDFSDTHGRCVVVVGIPYANQGDLFVRLKRQYITAVAPQRPKIRGKLFTGDDWYRQEALRSVNQAIGRVIRHKDDFGCVVLADPRYGQQRDALSSWIAAEMHTHEEFREAFAAVTGFFRRWHAQGRTLAARQPARGADDADVGAALDIGGAGTTATASAFAAVAAPPTAGNAEAFLEADIEKRKATVAHRSASLAAAASGGGREEGVHNGAPVGAVVAPSNGVQFAKQVVPWPPPDAAGWGQGAAEVIGAQGTTTATVGTGGSAATGHSASSSKAFCAALKERVTEAHYIQFRSLLTELARMMKDRGPVSPAAACREEGLPAFRDRFADYVKRVDAFFEEAFGSDAGTREVMLDTFVGFMPPALKAACFALLRKRRREPQR